MMRTVERFIHGKAVYLSVETAIAPAKARWGAQKAILHAVTKMPFFVMPWSKIRDMALAVEPNIDRANRVIAVGYQITNARAIAVEKNAIVGKVDGPASQVYFFFPTKEEALDSMMRHF